MRASLTIAGIPLLGVVEAPVRAVHLSPSAVLDPVDYETSATVDALDDGYAVIHPGFRIVLYPREASRLHCAANPAIDGFVA